MQKISHLDQQILKLQEKKKQLEIKRAVSLKNHLQKILKEDFSEALVLGVMAWANSARDNNEELREVWESPTEKFCNSF